MSSSRDQSAHRCPLCPDGRCPPNKAIPDCPQPDDERIANAERAVADVLAERFEFQGHKAQASAVVDTLAEPNFGSHLRSAVKWAIHRLVEKGMLSIHNFGVWAIVEPETPKRRFDRASGMFVYTPRPKETTFDWMPYRKSPNPADYSTFMIRAEESLWRWWRERTGEIEDRQRTYLSKELTIQLGVSSRTINAYAKKAGVKTPRHGERNHRYSDDDRRKIFECYAENGSDAKVKSKARGLLTKELRPHGDSKVTETSK
jgi:hypothetical protein